MYAGFAGEDFYFKAGGLLPGLSADNIQSGISQPRNRRLAEIFHRLKTSLFFNIVTYVLPQILRQHHLTLLPEARDPIFLHGCCMSFIYNLRVRDTTAVPQTRTRAATGEMTINALPFPVRSIGAFQLFECCSEFNIASAFHADSRNQMIAAFACLQPSEIKLIIGFFIQRKPVDPYFYALERVVFRRFAKETAFAFLHKLPDDELDDRAGREDRLEAV